MSDMIERVALAIREADIIELVKRYPEIEVSTIRRLAEDCWGDHLSMSRAAIEAMRQPDTQTILEATNGGRKRQSNGEFWHAIFDAALSKATPHLPSGAAACSADDFSRSALPAGSNGNPGKPSLEDDGAKMEGAESASPDRAAQAVNQHVNSGQAVPHLTGAK